MKVINRTPFTPLVFVAQDEDGDDFYSILAKGSLRITPTGRLASTGESSELFVADQYHGQPASSSVRFESDVVPFKLCTDIVVHADAIPPQGRPQRRWVASVRVGTLHKAIHVTGPRYWESTLLGARRLTEPELASRVPLRYELAYGGGRLEGDDAGPRDYFSANPVGRGYHAAGVSTREVVDAPQIESIDEPIQTFGRAYRVEGLGPLAKWWSPRRERAGTADETWLRTRWPKLPQDFDWRYYSGAHPDLVYPGFLRGDERVVLEGMTEQPRLSFTLPGYVVGARTTDADRYSALVPLDLDTLCIDTVSLMIHLSWRGTQLRTAALREVHLLMQRREVGLHG